MAILFNIYSPVKNFLSRLFSKKQLCIIHFHYEISGVVGSGKKTETIFAYVNLARATKKDCSKLFSLPNAGKAKIKITDVNVIPVKSVENSKSLI